MNSPALCGRVLLVDDHPLFHEGLASALRHAGRGLTMEGSETVEQAMRRVESGESFDAVLIDLMMPGTDGLRALTQFGATAPWLPRVLMSGRLDVDVIGQARRLGASAFIAKSWPVRRIVDVIHAVIEGGVDFSALDELQPARASAALTERQWTVLRLLAQGKSNKEMARELDIADRTVRAHLTDLFQALGAASRVQALLNAQRAGLIDASSEAGAPAP